jgi:hypothetical protein
MMKILLTLAILGTAAPFADLAIAQGAQGKQGEAFGGDVSSLQAKLAAQCAHRRTMPPDPRYDCDRKLRNDAQLGYGQGGASASQASAAAPGNGGGQGGGPGNEGGQGIGPGNGNGQGIGPGNGGGQGKGRR